MTPPAALDVVAGRWGPSFLAQGFGAVVGLMQGPRTTRMMGHEVALLARTESLVRALEHEFGVTLPDAVAVKEYLVRFPDTHRRVYCLAYLLHHGLGQQARLELEINRDPEIEDVYLVLLLRMPSYDERTYDRIRSIRHAINRTMPRGEGRVLATTDFR